MFGTFTRVEQAEGELNELAAEANADAVRAARAEARVERLEAALLEIAFYPSHKRGRTAAAIARAALDRTAVNVAGETPGSRPCGGAVAVPSTPPAPALCDGSRECPATVHVHGCFKDNGRNCDDAFAHGRFPERVSDPPVSGETPPKEKP